MEKNARYFVLALAIMASLAPGQGTRAGQGIGREQMWPAPTAEDWKKPVLITFQRTWKDALAVSKETGKPILICINMDGEIASEHFAGIRYREKEIAKLYEPYVCVIASTYRHTPRDHDDRGRRIPCPRFGSVTCGEHIAIEPLLFEKYMDGQRIAPRHICIDLDGKEVYDVFFRNDTASVFAEIRDQRPAGRPTTIVRGDRPIVERVASRDVKDREAVEAAYLEGDAATRQKILDAARQHDNANQLDLLRLAIFGMDTEASRKARAQLAKAESADATDLISEAMRVPMDPKERAALITTLKRLGKNSPLARWLAGVHQGLGAETVIDLKGWRGATAKGSPKRGIYSAPDLMSQIESRARASGDKPADAESQLALAEATLALAIHAEKVWSNPRIARMMARHNYEYAQKFAAEAEQLGAKGWRLDAVVALARYYGGEPAKAYARAETAVKALPPGDTSWASMAVVTVFAEGRWKTIKASVKEKKEWDPTWLADLDAAYSLLLKHPLGTDRQVLFHFDLLVWLRAHWRANRVLSEGIARFRDSSALHEKYRERILRWRGPTGLEQTYGDLLAKHKDPARLEPYAGLASVAAAEQYRRLRKNKEALAAYGRAIEHFEKSIAADASANRLFADHAIALALAGRARVAYQLDDDAAATKDILASLQRRPGSAGTRDGMNVTPGETAQMLLSRLKTRKKAELETQLSDALKKIDPALLRPDVGLGGGG